MFLLEEVWLKYRDIVPSKITAPQYCVKKVESKTKLILFLITSYLTGATEGPIDIRVKWVVIKLHSEFSETGFPSR